MARADTDEPLKKASSTLVLVVDDNPEIRSSLEEVLGEEGYAVVGVADGREALDYLTANEEPRVILLDLMMPVMDGWQFRAEQKKNPKLANIPVIVISAMADAAQDIGAERVLSKPLSPETLLRAVKDYC
jgi:CheY-like chemotaxis protein